MKNSPYRLKKYDIISLETVSKKKERNSTLKMSLAHYGHFLFYSSNDSAENPMSTKKFVNPFFWKKVSKYYFFSRYQRELMNLVICLSPLFTNKRTERFWLAVLQVSFFVFFSIFHYSSTPFKNTQKTLLLCSPGPSNNFETNNRFCGCWIR